MSNMAYEPYVTASYYFDEYGGTILRECADINQRLRQASRHIDSLTYNRMIGRGFSNLTPFQQETIREVVCQQADFEYENTDEISTILSSYSLNGASVQFGQRWNVFTDKGVAMMRDTYALLSQTGLCCRLAR